jgi:hypothetical protein
LRKEFVLSNPRAGPWLSGDDWFRERWVQAVMVCISGAKNMKRSNHGTQLDESIKHKQAPEPISQNPPTGKRPNDAREDEEQLAQNQDELGVGDDHLTEDMEKGGRGTFP